MNASYNEIKESFNALRKLTRETINEAIENDTNVEDAIPYTNQDEILTSVISQTKSDFGADYTDISNPMLYYPHYNVGGNEGYRITLNGKVPILNNLLFQWDYPIKKCIIDAKQLELNKDNLTVLSRLFASYDNWVTEIGQQSDSKPLNYKNRNNTE